MTYDEDDPSGELLIPTINTQLMEKNMLKNDPFLNKKGDNNKMENDPRDGPMDGIRRKFPKLMEDESTYEGEWKDGKRDGYGILCWGDESKFLVSLKIIKLLVMENYGTTMMFIKVIGKIFKLKE